MDHLFQDKLHLLELYYPSISPGFLQDFLTHCEGDIDKTRSLIDGGDQKAKKRSAPAQAALTSFATKRTKVDIGEVSSSKSSRYLSAISVSSESKNVDGSKPRKASKIITLNTPYDVQEHLHPYASLHLNFLPNALSDQVVQDLVESKRKFRSNKFYLFGNKCESNSTTGIFARPAAAYPQLVYNGLKRPKPFEYSEGMEDVAKFIEKFLNEKIIPKSDPLKWQSKEPWTNDFSVVNCYEKLQNNMDWHSDRLSHIGPHNYVASISLGTTRIFRLRSTYMDNAPIYEIPLPHNSLFIMRPGCQEEFKHCVNPMSKAIDVHPTLGSMRFGITARCYPTFFIENSPKCKCGTGMILRRSHKSLASRGKYFWSCENVYQNKGCTSFHWCDFENVKGHYIAVKDDKISTWVAPEDIEKIKYDEDFSNSSHHS